MNIYHGSKAIIEHPKFKGSNPNNDYGPSFYLTLDLDLAKSWACKNNSTGIVNVYKVSSEKFKRLKILDLTDKSKYSFLNWIAILMNFRELNETFKRVNFEALEWLKKYYIDVNDYDVIIGYRADDAYFRFPLQFISNNLAVEDMEEIFLLGNLGIQYAFMSEKAIKTLEFSNAIQCEDKFIGRYLSIILEATNDFENKLNRPKKPNKHYMLDLVRGNYEI